MALYCTGRWLIGQRLTLTAASRPACHLPKLSRSGSRLCLSMGRERVRRACLYLSESIRAFLQRGLGEEKTDNKKRWRRLVSAIERSEQNTGTGQGHPISTRVVTLYGYNEAFGPFGPTGPSTWAPGHQCINSSTPDDYKLAP